MKSLANTFGRPRLDRRTIERADDAWIGTLRESLDARFIVLAGPRCLVDAAPRLVTLPHEALPPGWPAWQSVFLGMDHNAPLFALAAPADAEAHFARHGNFSELRPVATLLPDGEAAAFAHARAVLHWHRLNRYCGGCGGKLACAAGGHARRCDDPECEVGEIFPRIDPAVIVLVTHGERCLLGRQASWPPGRYSCLAGFAEAGETLEETVRREVHEEAGVELADIRYHSSQPWPFPQSLMIGFHAVAASPDITLHDDELEDARWFSRDELLRALDAGELKPSSRLSIAYRLLRDWYAEAADPADLDRHAD